MEHDYKTTEIVKHADGEGGIYVLETRVCLRCGKREKPTVRKEYPCGRPNDLQNAVRAYRGNPEAVEFLMKEMRSSS